MADIYNKPDESSENRMYEDESCSIPSADIQNDLFLHEANKLVQMTLERDYAIEEKDKTIEHNMEAMDNMKKNVVHLQMEYELLDNKYHTEISYRDEIEKRNETTRSLIESIECYFSILGKSIQQTDEDKFKLTKYYNEINRRQDSIIAKRKELDEIVKQQDELIQKEVIQAAANKKILLEEINELKSKILQVENKLAFTLNEKHELEKQVGELKNEMNDMQLALVTEKNIRIQDLLTASELKKKIVVQKAKVAKIREDRENFYKKKIKSLNSTRKALKQNLSVCKEETVKILDLNKDLERKSLEMQMELNRICDNNLNEVRKMEEKLNASMCENEDLKLRFIKYQEEVDNQNSENRKLNETLYETVKLKLREKEDKFEKALEENSVLKNIVDKLKTELQAKSELTDYLNAKTESAKELSQKVNDLECKLQMSNELESELKNKIALLNEKLSIESSHYGKLMSEQQARNMELENAVEKCNLEIRTNKCKLDESVSKCNALEIELEKKSAEVEKLLNEMNLTSKEKEVEQGSKKTELNIPESNGKMSPTISVPSRRLLSTPARLLHSPVSYLKLTRTTSTAKGRDPYEFDSDSSAECFNTGRVLKDLKAGNKKENTSRRRGK